MDKISQNLAIKALIRLVASDRSGVTAIEYGLIAGLIAVGLVSVLGLVQNSLINLFTSISVQLQTA